MTAKQTKDQVAEVALSKIDEPGNIVRMEISSEAISELAKSISEIGLLQPVLLRPVGARFEIIAGHRRYLAHKQLGLETIRAIVKSMTDQEAAVSRATENLARVDLTPIEEAAIFRDLRESHEMSLDQIGVKFGKSPGLIQRRMDLLKMPPQLQQALHKKQISIGVAEALWPITDIPTLEYYLSFAVDGGCTVAIARGWCKDWRDAERRKKSDVVGGIGVENVFEPRPVYMSCDLCAGPVELGQEIVLRVCPACHEVIKNNM